MLRVSAIFAFFYACVTDACECVEESKHVFVASWCVLNLENYVCVCVCVRVCVCARARTCVRVACVWRASCRRAHTTRTHSQTHTCAMRGMHYDMQAIARDCAKRYAHIISHYITSHHITYIR